MATVFHGLREGAFGERCFFSFCYVAAKFIWQAFEVNLYLSINLTMSCLKYFNVKKKTPLSETPLLLRPENGFIF